LTSLHEFDKLRVVLHVRAQRRFSTNPITNKGVASQQLFLLKFWSFGGKNDKVLSEDALVKAEATLDLRIV
jgi:hypothetical protein